MSTMNTLQNWFDEAMNESNEFYIEDIREESASSDEYSSRLEEEIAEAEVKNEDEYLDYLNSQYNDSIEWYIDNFGVEDFGKACAVALGYKTWNDFRRY